MSDCPSVLKPRTSGLEVCTSEICFDANFSCLTIPLGATLAQALVIMEQRICEQANVVDYALVSVRTATPGNEVQGQSTIPEATFGGGIVGHTEEFEIQIDRIGFIEAVGVSIETPPAGATGFTFGTFDGTGAYTGTSGSVNIGAGDSTVNNHKYVFAWDSLPTGKHEVVLRCIANPVTGLADKLITVHLNIVDSGLFFVETVELYHNDSGASEGMLNTVSPILPLASGDLAYTIPTNGTYKVTCGFNFKMGPGESMKTDLLINGAETIDFQIEKSSSTDDNMFSFIQSKKLSLSATDTVAMGWYGNTGGGSPGVINSFMTVEKYKHI